MMHRAGKPEFFCLGVLGATADKIRKRDPERYVWKVIKPEMARAIWDTPHPTKEVARVCQAYIDEARRREQGRIPLSYPLEHALKLTIELCGDVHAGPVLDQFIRTSLAEIGSGSPIPV